MTSAAWSATAPRAESVTIEVTIGEGVATVILGGELDLSSRDFLAEHLDRVAAREPWRLLFDMAAVRFVDCAAARTLVGTARFLPPGSRPVIRNVRPAVRRLLELTGLEAHCVLEESGRDHLG